MELCVCRCGVLITVTNTGSYHSALGTGCACLHYHPGSPEVLCPAACLAFLEFFFSFLEFSDWNHTPSCWASFPQQDLEIHPQLVCVEGGPVYRQAALPCWGHRSVFSPADGCSGASRFGPGSCRECLCTSLRVDVFPFLLGKCPGGGISDIPGRCELTFRKPPSSCAISSPKHLGAGAARPPRLSSALP